MKKRHLTAGLGVLIYSIPLLCGAEDNNENLQNLGELSTGFLSVSLEITEDIAAGFLKTSLGSADPEINELLSNELVQSIKNEIDTTLPFCVMSSGGGYFEVAFVEQAVNTAKTLDRGLGPPPLEISFGENALSSIKYQSVVEECNAATSIPVTINLNKQYSGGDVGRVYGRFNLLVKSE